VSTVKTVRLSKNVVKAIARWARLQKIDQSTAIRQLLAIGVEDVAVKLYREGQVTLNEAAELADVNLREMVDILASHGVPGNIKLDQQKKAIDFAMTS
jgi:hypothetical protein